MQTTKLDRSPREFENVANPARFAHRQACHWSAHLE